ncbi:MAG TPA: hypothetical protein VE379_03020, partial [Vicinamibacterales bacterium]|nr:hypothetical protein [Vicinamibacterales bacterium]
MNLLLARHVGAPLDLPAVEQDKRNASRATGLLVQGRIKPHAPPFMMLGINLENTTSSDFRITATARYLAFDT